MVVALAFSGSNIMQNRTESSGSLLCASSETSAHGVQHGVSARQIKSRNPACRRRDTVAFRANGGRPASRRSRLPALPTAQPSSKSFGGRSGTLPASSHGTRRRCRKRLAIGVETQRDLWQTGLQERRDGIPYHEAADANGAIAGGVSHCRGDINRSQTQQVANRMVLGHCNRARRVRGAHCAWCT